MDKYNLAEETLGYVTSTDPSNTDKRMLISGSKNVLIDYQKKVKTRSGYTLLGVANQGSFPIRNAWTWFTSTGFVAPQRFYNNRLEVWLGTVDGVVLNAWYYVSTAFSTTEMLRPATWFDTTENIDLQVMVNGDANTYEWSGAVAVVASITATTVTKQGTSTFAQNRFYASANKTFVVQRTGTEFTYTGGETTTTLTGITDTSGIVAGDVIIQQIVTRTNNPAASRNNDTIYSFENQLYVGSYDDEEIQISRNTSTTTFTYSSPRVPGEGGLLTLDDISVGFASIGKFILCFAGRSTVFRANYEQITVGSTLAETLQVKKLQTGVDQGAQNQETILQLGNSVAFLTNEPTLRIISNPEDLEGVNPKTFSNPIKPDFDGETWTNAQMYWYKNILFISAPVNSRFYMLNFVEDADGRVLRFWNPPQTMPIRAFSIIDSGSGYLLHGHSNASPETYLLFDGASDGQFTGMDSSDKIPIDAKATFAYNDYGDRVNHKCFDEYYIDGELTPATQVTLSLYYDFGGVTQTIQKTIDGSDPDILEEAVGYHSLGQSSLAVNPLGGLLNAPTDAKKFRVIFEIAKEDFQKLAAEFTTNDVDKYWAIIAHGSNAKLSPRKNLIIKK